MQCAAKSPSKNSGPHGRRSTNCSNILNARSRQGRGSSAASSLSLKSLSRPTCFASAALGADQFWSRQRRPRVNSWYENLAARPAFKTAVLWPDELGGGYEEVGLGSTVKRA